MVEDKNNSDDSEGDNKKGKKDKSGTPLVDVAYRRAKATKAAQRSKDAGKKLKNVKKQTQQPQSRIEEMQELFQSDMSERHQKKTNQKVGRKSKNSFKSKSRYYKRRK